MNQRTSYSSGYGYDGDTRGQQSYDSYDYRDSYYPYSPRYGDYSDDGNGRNSHGDNGHSNVDNSRSGSQGFGQNVPKYGSYASGYGDKCPGISIALLLISLLGIFLMGYILYLKVVAAGTKKKRATTGIDSVGVRWFLQNIESIIYSGKPHSI